MSKNTEKLTTAFTKLTNVLMGETENEDDTKQNDDVSIDPSGGSNTSVNGMRNTRVQDTIQDDNKGKNNGEVPDVYPTTDSFTTRTKPYTKLQI
jgi:hypothetical protein